MNFRIFVILLLITVSGILISCSGNKQATVIPAKTTEKPKPPAAPQSFTFLLHFTALGSSTLPHDEIWIDTSGQMTFETHQHMKDGSWITPRGLAYLEPRDEDTLYRFMKEDALFSIDESDVSPICGNGDIYTLKMYRSDLKKELSIKTNTCVFEYNLLTGPQRKIFPLFLAFINRIRERYRPGYTE